MDGSIREPLQHLAGDLRIFAGKARMDTGFLYDRKELILLPLRKSGKPVIDLDLQPLLPGKGQNLPQQRHLRATELLTHKNASIQSLQLCKGQLRNPYGLPDLRAIRVSAGAVNGLIVDDHTFSVRGKQGVKFNDRIPLLIGCRESRHGIFRVLRADTPMRLNQHNNTPPIL